jgi:hypothetical protein
MQLRQASFGRPAAAVFGLLSRALAAPQSAPLHQGG